MITETKEELEAMTKEALIEKLKTISAICDAYQQKCMRLELIFESIYKSCELYNKYR